MGRHPKDPEDMIDKLQKEIQESRSTIKSLRKRLKTLEKERLQYLDLLEEETGGGFEELKKNDGKCQACGKGTVEILDLGRKLLEVCNTCKIRRTIEKK